MTKTLLVLFAVTLVLGFALNVGAQTTLPLLWQDTFDDAADTLAWNNVGWIYYSESDGLVGSAVRQQDGLLYMKAGSFGGLVGAVVAETNGLPVVGLDENGDMTPEMIAGLHANNFNDPNVEYTFQVNFKKITSSFFLLSARMVQNDDSLDSDPTEQPGYALFISPLTGDVNVGKYEGDMAILDPTAYTYFGQGAKFDFDQGVFYWIKYYLKNGDIKVKIWEGELEDEEDGWLLELTDPAPRVTGKFMSFGLLNPSDPLAGDEIEIDNLFARATSRFPVTFQLNMDVQEQLGNFNPETDKVVVRGSFNGWAGVADSLIMDEDDGLYKATIGIPDSLVGTGYEYKFVILPAGGKDVWEDVPNRTFTLEDGGNVLDPVYFGDVESVGTTANITFQADMSDMLSNNWFDPTTDQMRVTGGFNGWGYDEAYALEADLIDPSLYLKTISYTAETGKEIQWKFRGFPEDHFLDSGWEAGGNHVFTFTGEDIVLDKLKPQVNPGGKPLTQDVTVRFSVDVNNAKDWYNKQPFQNIKSVWVTGDWNNWGGSWSVSDTTTLIRMYDDGTNGDATAGDGVWTTDVLFATDSPGAHLYKYSIYADGVDTLNGGTSPMDNEAGVGMNHILLINDSAPLFVNAQDVFGSQWVTGVKRVTTDALPRSYALDQNYPNPFNPTTEIAYEIPTNSHVVLTIFNALGQRINTLVDKEQAAGRYQVTWDGLSENGARMSSGVYFYHIQAEGFSKTMKMILMK